MSSDDPSEKPRQRPFIVDSRMHIAVNRGATHRSAFVVDDRIGVKMEYDLAIRLGELILAAGITNDNQLVALGHNLVNLAEKSED